jgi:hypothetical protein
LIIGGVLKKVIVDSENENSEKFGNNNADKNVSRVFARI